MIWIGTSGYNYPEWKGVFYPPDLPSARMLAFYATHLPTVEINYTFYRIPNEKIVAGWDRQTPGRFKLTLKAPRRITHDQRLRDAGELARGFCRTAGTLGPKLGALLFQLPPTFRKDVAIFEAFLRELPHRAPAAFEFRHPSWFDEDVFALLRGHGMALCVADSEKLSAPLTVTADFAYFRLRDEGYLEADLERWARDITAATGGCSDVFVYFKHEDKGMGPVFAKKLIDILQLNT
jgi:uncharacterized protein YecE (DUF72 family)